MPKNAEQVVPDRAVAEGVDARQHAGAGEERAEDRQRERRHEQAEVPDPQHPSALLDEHRVDVGRARQPRQEAGVLHRVPRPHAAPAEHLVAPPAAEQDADRQEGPREQRPAAGLHQPALADAPGDQRGDGERERHREPDVAEVQDRRVEQHEDVVLQQRVGARVRRAAGTTADVERIGRAEAEQGEERHDDEHHDERPADERVVGAAPEAPPDGGREPGEDRRPTAGSSPRGPTTWRRRCTAPACCREPTCWM